MSYFRRCSTIAGAGVPPIRAQGNRFGSDVFIPELDLVCYTKLAAHGSLFSN
jgi:hypothetical protein